MTWIQIDGAIIWAAKAQRGVPLDMALDMCKERGMVPNWTQLVAAAAKDGINVERFKKELARLVQEVYHEELEFVGR